MIKLVKTISLIIYFTSISTLAKQPIVATYYVPPNSPIAVSESPAEKLTHIIYAFIALCGDNRGANDATPKALAIACNNKMPYSAVFIDEQVVEAELETFGKLKQQHPHLTLLPSFGGWTLSQPFHGMVSSSSSKPLQCRKSRSLSSL